jgi:hypothetical protein
MISSNPLQGLEIKTLEELHQNLRDYEENDNVDVLSKSDKFV